MLLHNQEHPGWFPTDFLLDGAEFWSRTSRRVNHVETRTTAVSGVWPSMAGNVPQAFLAGHFTGARLLVTHDRFAQAVRRRFFRGRGAAWANFGQIRLVLVRRLPVAGFREGIRIPRLLTDHADGRNGLLAAGHPVVGHLWRGCQGRQKTEGPVPVIQERTSRQKCICSDDPSVVNAIGYSHCRCRVRYSLIHAACESTSGAQVSKHRMTRE